MISVNESERRTQLEWLSNREVVKQIFSSMLSLQKPRMYDGYIHSSKLDWTRDPKKQFEDHLKGGFSGGNGYTRAGDLYHRDLEDLFDGFYGKGQQNGSYPEYKFRLEPLRLQGTVDRIQLGTPIGNILFEFKTTSTYHRNKTKGDAVAKKLLGMQRLHGLESGYTLGHLFNINPQLESLYINDLKPSLDLSVRQIKPEEKHLTQMFTYAWAFSNTFKIDHCALIYIARDTYEFTEFWYDMNHCQQQVNKAATNYMEVYKWLVQHNSQPSNGWIGR